MYVTKTKTMHAVVPKLEPIKSNMLKSWPTL